MLSYRLTLPLILSFLLISLTRAEPLGAFSRAQPTLPPCAVPCLQSALTNSECNINDDTCLCNSPAFRQSMTTCMQVNCTPADVTAATATLQQICRCVTK
ncbi:hypothetical protein BJV78DRAFT_1141576 [Lactifluus subvellereus]|nr:hypothetical protein BJV78DRAFT_1141576 [Lactifluus subvellereus]